VYILTAQFFQTLHPLTTLVRFRSPRVKFWISWTSKGNGGKQKKQTEQSAVSTLPHHHSPSSSPLTIVVHQLLHPTIYKSYSTFPTFLLFSSQLLFALGHIVSALFPTSLSSPPNHVIFYDLLCASSNDDSITAEATALHSFDYPSIYTFSEDLSACICLWIPPVCLGRKSLNRARRLLVHWHLCFIYLTAVLFFCFLFCFIFSDTTSQNTSHRAHIRVF